MRRGDKLSFRELQVLALGYQGKNSIQIGMELHRSENTIRTHFDRARKKLGARDKTHLYIKALERGILQLPGHEPKTSQDDDNS